MSQSIKKVQLPDMSQSAIPPDEFDQMSMEDGLQTGQSAREAPLSFSPYMTHVRFLGGGVRKDFGWTALSTAMASTCYGLGDWYSAAGGRQLIRIRYKFAGAVWFLSLQTWNGAAWSADHDSAVTDPFLNNQRACIMSTQDLCLIANGNKIQSWNGAAFQLLSASAPYAFWVAPFEDRAVAIYAGTPSDPQGLAWCASGNLLDWVGVGSGELVDEDSVSDTVDAMVCGIQVGAGTFAVFRERSIERMFPTGNIDQALGIVPWIQGVGTVFPFTVKAVQEGAIFVSADLMVSHISASGQITAIGDAIQDELRTILDRSSVVPSSQMDGAYDYQYMEYYLGVNPFSSPTEIYIFDVGEFVSTGKKVWRKREVGYHMLANSQTPTVSSSQIVTSGVWLADSGDKIVRIDPSATSLAGTAFTGKWQSGTLNRKDSSRVAELVMLILYCTAVSGTTVTLKVSGNGCQSFNESLTVTIPATTGQVLPIPVVCNTQGLDLRFEIDFDQTPISNVIGFHPVIVDRGRAEYA